MMIEMLEIYWTYVVYSLSGVYSLYVAVLALRGTANRWELLFAGLMMLSHIWYST